MKSYLIRKIYVIEAENKVEVIKLLPKLKDSDLKSTEIWGDVNKDIKDPDFASLIEVIQGEK